MGGGEVLSKLGLNLPANSPVTPQEAQQVSPDTVKEVANQAQQQNPGIVQQAGEFYSQHPQLVQALLVYSIERGLQSAWSRPKPFAGRGSPRKMWKRSQPASTYLEAIAPSLASC